MPIPFPDNTEHILFYVAYIIMSRKADFFLQNLCKNILYITLGFETIYYEKQIKKIQMNNHAKMETDKTILISNRPKLTIRAVVMDKKLQFKQ